MHRYTLFDTRLGRCAVVWTERGIAGLQLPERDPEATLARVCKQFPHAEGAEPPRDVRAAIERITAHLAGTPQDLSDIVLDTAGLPPFFTRVYEKSREVGPGTTVTYGELAKRVGSPGAARAVGQAMGKNPFAVIVPCHRVLASGGAAGGFSAYGGVDTKARMLALEGVADLLSAPKPATLPLFDGAKALAFDADRALRSLAARDKTLARLIERVGPFGLRLKGTGSTFEALAESIVYQQLTGKAAETILGRVRALFRGGRLPSPRAFLAMPERKLRGAGLSRSKVLAVKDLARKSIDGTVPTLAALERLSDDAIVERLTAVRGIGRWTVEMLLIFRLGRPDILPVHDYGIRKGFALAYRTRELPKPADLEARGEKWRPYRTVASWYLWRALDAPKKTSSQGTRSLTSMGPFVET